MSRPSTREQARLERLEGLAAQLDEIQRAAGILDVRLRQMLRRAPRVRRWLDLANEELARLADSCDDAQELLFLVLDAEQEARCRDNGSDTGGGRC